MAPRSTAVGDARVRAVAYARSLDGASANPGDPYSRAEYERAIARGETEARAEEMARMSGCALLAAGVLRHAGVRCPALDPPYRTGTAVSRLVAAARAGDAWRMAWAPPLPSPGDVVILGPPEHVFTVLEVLAPAPPDPPLLLGLDGGQRDPEGYQIARLKVHEWSGIPTVDSSRLHSGGPWSKPRRVLGWIDLDAMISAYP